ncbi:hypothetical protein EVAR_12286_1 [Eumeta japonica]|uniref:Uncharacterized protein n=1 Tax=Eumeta variegata TaxID=151549 RepID=A0A4C1TU79_EUMVA|nr:hypothetical protein EVAR_12286_1 [Eumeta japonica]
MKTFVVLLACIGLTIAKPAGSDDDVMGSVIGAVKKCAEKDVSLCLKERALRYVENLASSREVSITDGVTIIGTGSPRSARALEPLSEEPRARESQVENRLIDTIAEFLENQRADRNQGCGNFTDPLRRARTRRKADAASSRPGLCRTRRQVRRVVRRGKKKKLKQLMPILALLQLKIQSLIPLFLGIIAFAAVKGLMIAKAALLASALVLLKKLLSKHDHHESYEVVAHPHHDEHFSHGGHGGWGRASQDAQNLAYSAYSN